MEVRLRSPESGDGPPGRSLGSERGSDRSGTDPDALEFVDDLIDLLIERILPYEAKALTLKQAGDCLKVLGKIWNLSEYPPATYASENPCCENREKLMDMEGYVDEYQYLHLEALDMDLTGVKIIPQYFVWLLSVDLSGNLLTNVTSCPITKLPNLVALRLNRNQFRDPFLPAMKHLQYLGLNTNKITSIHRIYHPNLETLDLNYNRIKEVNASDCWKLAKLAQLELRGNMLRTTSGIEYATLVNLYLAQNQIVKLEGLEILVNLERLHLRENPLSDLAGFTKSNIKLKYLNLRRCQVSGVDDLRHLAVLAGLKELVVKGNPFNPETTAGDGGSDADADDNDDDDEEEQGAVDEEEEESGEISEMRLQILYYLPHLKRIDKKLVTKEEQETVREMLEEQNA